jgi:hypothetical protein
MFSDRLGTDLRHGCVRVQLQSQPTPSMRFTMKRAIIAAAFLATGVLAAAPSYALTRGDLIGEPGRSGSLTRTIRVTPGTRYINVLYSETVNLDVNGKTTTWKFDGLKAVVSLRDIIPDAPNANVYVTPSDRYAPWSAP